MIAQTDEDFIIEVAQRLEAILRFRHRLTWEDAHDAAAAAVERLCASVTRSRLAYSTAAVYAGAVAASAAEDFRRSVRVQRCQGAHLVVDEVDPRLRRPKRQIVTLDARAHEVISDTDVERTVTERLDATAVLGELSPREKELIWFIKAEQHPVGETARRLNLSREHASRLVTHLMDQLAQHQAAA